MQQATISFHASQTPDKPAVVMGSTGAVTSFAELEAASSQCAHLFRALHTCPGEAIAVCVENSAEFFAIAWGALRSGLTVVPISTKLTPAEIAFIVGDSGSKLLIMSTALGDTCARMPSLIGDVALFGVGQVRPSIVDWVEARQRQPTSTIPGEELGREMLYSSGTTGRPKGIDYLGTGQQPGGLGTAILPVLQRLGFDDATVYLCPAPLYHAAPFAWSLGTLRLGGTVVVMERFDAELALALIERHRVTASQWVPTHFVRMLKLPEEARRRHDLSSMQLAIHAAAPCPVPVKEAMIEWWGEIVLEYFGSSEQSVLTMITSEEWLAHRGSVGRCVQGRLHICDEAGEPVAPRTIGQVYSEGGLAFQYHNDRERTAHARNRRGWVTVGDLGYLDEEGYLYLTDRKSFMIISGGVNIYPQEIENLLVTHPRVADAAVIGTPDPDLGEIVTAIVQPLDMTDATVDFADELKSWMRESLSSVKMPKRIEFDAELPRLPTGKMAKHRLRERYSG